MVVDVEVTDCCHAQPDETLSVLDSFGALALVGGPRKNTTRSGRPHRLHVASIHTPHQLLTKQAAATPASHVECDDA